MNGNLTIEPGTVIETGNGKGFFCLGSLKIVGTPTEKIIIRGDVQSPGAWRGIVYQETKSSNNQIKYAEIKHAGEGANPTANYINKGAIVLAYNPRLEVDNTVFEDIMSCIIFTNAHGAGNLTLGTNITKKNINTANLIDCVF